MKKSRSTKLTIWGATLFLSGAILVSGTYISAGAFFMMIGGIIGLLSLFHSNEE